MDRLRLPFFILAGLFLLLCVAVELGSGWLLPQAAPAGLDPGTPGLGIRYRLLPSG